LGPPPTLRRRVWGNADTVGPDVDGAVQEHRPPRSAGVVGQLLVDQAADQGDPDVELDGVTQADVPEELSSSLQDPDRGRIGLRARLEAGNRSLVQELVASRVGDREVEEHPRDSA
jgi:hypothetical protein